MKVTCFVIVALVYLAVVLADCGCLKCSKHLQVVSPPCSPIKVIFRGPQNYQYQKPQCVSSLGPLKATVESPLIAPSISACLPGKTHDYRVQPFSLLPPLPIYQCTPEFLQSHTFKVETPLILPQLPCIPKPIKSKFVVDRVVLPYPERSYNEEVVQPVQRPQIHTVQVFPDQGCAVPPSTPLFERIPLGALEKLTSECRYETNNHRSKRSTTNKTTTDKIHDYILKRQKSCKKCECKKSRTKRHLPIIKTGVHLFLNLLPSFIRFPLKYSLKTLAKVPQTAMRHHQMNQKHKKYQNVPPIMRNRERVSAVAPRYYSPNNPTYKQPYYINNKYYNNEINEEKQQFLTMLKNPKYLPNRLNDEIVGSSRRFYSNKPRYSKAKQSDMMSPEEKQIFLNKLKKLNGNLRKKRSLVFDSAEISLPFFRVTESLDDYSDSRSDEDYSNEDYFNEIVGAPRYYRKSNKNRYHSKNSYQDEDSHFDYLLSQTPLKFFVNAPMKLLSRFHKLRKNIAPVLKSVPEVVINSKKYLHDLRKSLKNNALDMTSNLVGDFDDHSHINQWDKILRHDRYKRSLEQVEKPQTITQSKLEKEIVTTQTSKNTTTFVYNNNNKTVISNSSQISEVYTIKDHSKANKSDGQIVVIENRYFDDLNNDTEDNSEKDRNKRYILKVVNEDDVEDYIKEKLGGLMPDLSGEEILQSKRKEKRDHNNKPDKKCKHCNRSHSHSSGEEHSKTGRKKYVVEKLSPKIIIDNKGRPFVEIDGVKRPMFLNRKRKTDESNSNEDKTSSESNEESEESKYFDVQDRISTLIERAREKVGAPNNEGLMSSSNTEVPVQVIKEKITQILTDIQELVNMDYHEYILIHDELTRLEHLKNTITDEWKQLVMSDKMNDLNSRIRLLDYFKKLQIAKDEVLKNIASILQNGNNFMSKKLIKVLVRLQKLQCIIYRVVDDFGEKIKMGTNFNEQTEIKYIDYLSKLSFVVSRSRSELEKDLNSEKDSAMEREMDIMESLRNLLNEDKTIDINDESKFLWEIKNIGKITQDTIATLNEKINDNQKIRKELKILFDLLRQLENIEHKQAKLLSNYRGSSGPKLKKTHSESPLGKFKKFQLEHSKKEDSAATKLFKNRRAKLQTRFSDRRKLHSSRNHDGFDKLDDFK